MYHTNMFKESIIPFQNLLRKETELLNKANKSRGGIRERARSYALQKSGATYSISLLRSV